MSWSNAVYDPTCRALHSFCEMTEEEGTPQKWTGNALMLTTFQMPLNVWKCSNINWSNIGIKNLINVRQH